MQKAIPQFQHVADELAVVVSNLKSLLTPIAGNLIDRLLPGKKYELLLPAALTVLCGSPENAANTRLAAVMITLVHLGTTLHHLPDSEESDALLILAGDYLYSHLLQLLCTTDTLFLMDRLARLIAEISESYLLWDNVGNNGSPDWDKLINSLRQRYGALFGEGCAVGSLLSGGNQDLQHALHGFGMDFGVAYGLTRHNLDRKQAEFYLRRSQGYLETIGSVGARNLSEMAQRVISAPLAAEVW